VMVVLTIMQVLVPVLILKDMPSVMALGIAIQTLLLITKAVILMSLMEMLPKPKVGEVALHIKHQMALLIVILCFLVQMRHALVHVTIELVVVLGLAARIILVLARLVKMHLLTKYA